MLEQLSPLHPLGAFLSIPLLCAAVLPSAGDHAVDPRQSAPNIICILTDDLGWGDVGFNGRREWATPNLDRLAQEGTIFRRWYVASPVCAPSRAALLTGKYTIHCGVPGNGDDLPAGEVTIAEALRARGYTTALFGKWHRGGPREGKPDFVHPLDQGFDEFLGFTSATEAWEHFPKELWHGREKRAVQGHSESMFVDRSIDFVRRSRGRPFFLYLSLNSPHFHIEAPGEDVAPFRGKFPEKDPARPVNATYAAMIARTDREIGRLLSLLDETGLAKDTLVLFTSDNGATFETRNFGASAFHDSNRPFRGGKRTLWEGGIRVPAAIRWPGRVPAGRTSGEIVHAIDVMPTLLAAAGVAPDSPWKVDGANLLAVWEGRERSPDRTLFWEWQSEGHDQLAAMRGDLKLVISGGGRRELFDVTSDPAERRNIMDDHPDLVAKLGREVESWLETETDVSREGRPAGKAGTKKGSKS